MAAVDIERLCVIRASEREMLPNNGARYGNFGVVNVSEDETWITEAEWMQVPKIPNSPQRGGSIAMPRWGELGIFGTCIHSASVIQVSLTFTTPRSFHIAHRFEN